MGSAKPCAKARAEPVVAAHHAIIHALVSPEFGQDGLAAAAIFGHRGMKTSRISCQSGPGFRERQCFLRCSVSPAQPLSLSIIAISNRILGCIKGKSLTGASTDMSYTGQGIHFSPKPMTRPPQTCEKVSFQARSRPRCCLMTEKP